ncbi:MAG: fibronectin type III domain-containing protein [Actinobacteria bacterium]|nr:fibronectin type III domain-containing protein [Actinomycetota bacterium]
MRTAIGDIPDRLFRDMTMADAWEYLRAQRARPSRRQFLKGLGAASAVATVGPILWRQPAFAAGVAPAGVHIAFGADPTGQMTVSWSTPQSVTNPRLLVGPDTTYGASVPAVTETVGGVSTLYHHAPVTGLSPGATYQYKVVHDTIDPANEATGSFTTAPAGAGPFTFAAMGDMGANADAASITAMIGTANPDLVFMVGDLCYADRLGGAVNPPPGVGPFPGVQDLKIWDSWLSQIEPVAKTTPWMVTAGNHEMEIGQGPLGYDGFLSRMVLPGAGVSGTTTWWAQRYANVAFVALDANDVSYEITRNQGYAGTAQDAWLAATLAALRADPAVDFIVVGFHHCAYCSNSVHGSDGGVRDAWEALFDQHQVDLVINGHNHSYERTHPLKAGEHDPAGTVYVTAGGGGQAPYPSTLHPVSYVTNELGVRVPELAEWSAARYLGDHSLLVADVFPATGSTAARMELRALAEDLPHNVVDAFTLTARA